MTLTLLSADKVNNDCTNLGALKISRYASLSVVAYDKYKLVISYIGRHLPQTTTQNITIL